VGAGVSSDAGLVAERARRLLRWYPRSWRERYGEEFSELLNADLSERPRCWRRTADIAVSGMGARLSVGGLGGSPIGQPQAALAVVGGAMVGFVACGVSLWSQLLVGWRWAPPDSDAVVIGVLVMSLAVVYLSVLALLATVPVIAAVLRAARRRDARRLIGPMALIIVSAAILIVGGHHLESGWPGTGGHSWRFQRLVPGGVGGFGWAETLGITAYWAHPSDLLALPHPELAWVAMSPVALTSAVVSAARVVRRVTLSPASLRYEASLAKAAAAGMVPFLGAAAWWVTASRAGSNDLFRAGSLDVLLVAAMAAALVVARTATRQIRHGTGL
jgi:hypothetical protein